MTTVAPPAPPRRRAVAGCPTSSRACASWGGGSRPARRRPAAAAPARSRTAGWSCCRATRRCGPRCSASWTWRPRARDRRDLAAHLASLLGEVERPLAPVGAFTRRGVAAGRVDAARPSARVAGPRGAPDGEALHRRRGPGGRRARARAPVAAPARRPPWTCSARRPSPPPRPTATPGAATRRCARWRTPRRRGPRGRTLGRQAVPRVNLARQGHRAHRAGARRGARARDRGRQAPAARPSCARPRRSARTCTSTWSRWTRAT